ncbi:hypothetical protein A9Q74_16495 [Colwellia sp. 39_35_sub15_T18]|nr:hypothetical protein A9Q74_16495 [Colwellia sp. 39_35_sub15_T18]
MISKSKHCEIEAYVNSGVIKALHLRDTPERSYKLAKADLQFVIDERLQVSFSKKINEIKLKLFIQKSFKGPLHLYDTSELCYININGLPAVWHITTVDKNIGEMVKAKHFQHQNIVFKLTVFKACDFARINQFGVLND